MSKSLCTAVVAVALFAATSAWAGVGKGDLETGVNLSYSQYTISTSASGCTSDSTIKIGSFAANVGYFITDMIELKAALSDSKNDSNTSGCGAATKTSSTTGTLSPGADFVFLGKSGKAAPFAGAAYAKALGDKAGPVKTDFYDVHAGAKFFITERATIELKLTRFEPTDSKADGRTELAAGVNVYF